MFWIDFLFAVVFAVFFVWLLGGVFRRRSPWPITFFFVFFLFLIWAGGVWIVPFGPVLWEGYWLPFFLTGLIFMLLFAALIPREAPRERMEETETGMPVESAAMVVLDSSAG